MLHSIPEGMRAQLLHQELLRQAEHERLVRLARAGCPGVGVRLLFALGGVLVAWGLWLKARYRAPTAAQAANTPLRMG